MELDVRNYIYNPKVLTLKDVDELCRDRSEESVLNRSLNVEYHKYIILENIALDD